MSVQQAITEIQRAIDVATRGLSDADYLEVLEEIESYCDACAEAKREELGK